MNPVVSVFDGFFKDPEVVHDVVMRGNFQDFKSPWDGVTYPAINKSLPNDVMQFVMNRLDQITGFPIDVVAMFSRVMSNATGLGPHRIHSDAIMGQFSAHIYLSKEWPAGAGTAFWSHKTQGQMHTAETDVNVAMADSHVPGAWDQWFFCDGAFNRLLIHDSRLWHSAEPAGGWGQGIKDGRFVLTCFFNAGR